MEEGEARALLRSAPGFGEVDATLEVLRGGLLNQVWRARWEGGSAVLKHAPPFVASDPSIPLDAARSGVEARALRLFRAPPWRDLATALVRPPRLLHSWPSARALLMEDVGPAPDLLEALERGAEVPEALGGLVGEFIGALHAASRERPGLAPSFDNAAIQATRRAIQYEAVGGWCAAAGLEGASEAGAASEALGARLCGPGRCVIMGDLWPRSVLVSAGGLRVIDWELAHYGQPEQDLGHLAAHLGMAARALPCPAARERADRARVAALTRWRAAACPPFTSEERGAILTGAAHHAGAEVLTRTLGAFRQGYLYDLLPSTQRLQDAAWGVALLTDPAAGRALLGPLV